MLKSFKIRDKLLISFGVFFFTSMLLVMLFTYVFVRNTIENNIESELNNTTQMILNMVETSAWVSIKNHLRAVAEKNEEIASYHYQLFKSGVLTEEDAKRKAADILLSQTIGESGYIYCLNSEGQVLVHPKEELINTSVADFDFVRSQMSEKQGYIEYEWKNPGEAKTRPKALYMVYFEPWDWIISVSAYRNEFMRLVNVEDFEKRVLSLKLGKTGYSFVVSSDGTAIVHPKLQGINIFKTKELPNQYLEEMLKRKKGKIFYPWQNPGENTPRKKLVMFNYIPELEWIVASSSYLDEFYSPLDVIRNFIIILFLLSLLVVFPVTVKISASITKPLQKLTQHFDQVSTWDFSVRMPVNSADEVGQLSAFFNRFMEQLEQYHKNLQDEINNRHNAEGEHLESQERYRSVMEAAPDPIVTYDMQGIVTYLNPAFTRVYGWTIEECLGRKLDHFVPENNWDETRMMINKVLSGEGIFNVETIRLTKSNEPLNINLSGAIYKDRNNQLAGSVLIHRDITKAKMLERQVMETSDRERQKIGQDLHDDLCPHLIGIAGLASVLGSNLESISPGNAKSCKKIVSLIEEAINKTKALARGLCPVYLVAHGLQSALKKVAETIEYSSEIEYTLEIDPDVTLLNNTEATNLYYIAQEAVNNAIRHSGASHIKLALGKSDDRIYLSIEDNGKGIPDRFISQGMGLQIMQYRAKMIHAGFDIKPASPTGTIVQISLKE